MKHTIILRITTLAMAASLAPTYATRLQDIKNANETANDSIAEINEDLTMLGPDLANAGVPLKIVNEKGEKGYGDTLKTSITKLTYAITTLKAQLVIALTNVDNKIKKLKELNGLKALAAQQIEQQAAQQTSQSSGSSHKGGSHHGR